MIRKFGKSIASLAAAVAVVVASVITDGVTQGEAVQIAVAFTAAVGVYLAPNLPQYKWIKTAVAATLAVLSLVTTYITDGITSAEVVNLIVAALGVLVTGAAPSISDTEPPTPVDQP
ncbi:MAG TPA: hypothetical protein VK453_25475 [Micromonosporaceae bacterium]|nr:hypothetical protein [Micromonosporaceae bacterium]